MVELVFWSSEHSRPQFSRHEYDVVDVPILAFPAVSLAWLYNNVWKRKGAGRGTCYSSTVHKSRDRGYSKCHMMRDAALT